MAEVIRKGYKQTKVGVVPEDWKVVRVGELGSLSGGGTPSTKNKEFWNGNIPWISSSDLTENSIYNIKISRYITEDSIQNSATKLVQKNSILIVSRVGVGKVAINKNDICTSQDFQNLTLKNNNTLFIAYLIKDKTKVLISYNQGTSIKGFVKSDLQNLKISLPPLKEQERISNILSTWDDAISKQDKLIKAKEKLKKGLMQKLLSGEIRFDGFFDEWKFTKLGYLLDYIQPTKYLVANKDYDNSYKIPVLTAGKTFILGYTKEENGIFEEDLPVIIFDDFTTATQFVDFPFKAKSSAMKILKAKSKDVNIKLVFEMMQILNYSADDHKRYWISEYQELEIKLPPLQEQQKIAEVLNNADKEIDLLKNELQELKEQKKGLMQKLLTGEVRVKV
ncbi:MAG: restriction endonuclease subunit S [Sulfurimonas sp.]|nr:MAG: restriction endonuclease subunit S [Sulfurimonas sp.]